MAGEIEIKLEIPASAASKVMRLPWLWEQASGEVQPAHMTATYFDTPKRDLRKRGLSFRIRRVGDKRVQTVKAAANGDASPITRHEWETEISGDAPELRHASGTPLEDFSKKKLRKTLAPVFEVKVERSAYPVQSANSAIEIAIDRGHIEAASASASFCEIELELKRGASSELARLGRRIASEVPASLGLKTKADRGFELRYGKSAGVYRSEPIQLQADAMMGESFQLIGWSCLRQFALNADAVRIGDPEGVHQMRIGLRRLRALKTLFKELIDGPETDAVETELEWITGELARARDLHVFMAKTLAPLSANSPDESSLVALCSEVAKRRDDAVERAKKAVNSDRFRQLVLRTALWLLAGEWSDTSPDSDSRPSTGLRSFARRTLEKRAKKLTRRIRHAADLSDVERHKLRIAVKKTRYASEFFCSLFKNSAEGQREFDTIMEALQDSLGRMNDIAVHRRLGRELVEGWIANDVVNDPAAATNQYALGLAIGQEQHEIEASAAQALKAGRRLAALTPYWR